MRKKSLAIVLIAAILVLSAGSAYSGWGPKKNKFGPIVIQGHPWGESSQSIYPPPCYRPGPGRGHQDPVGAPTFTNFVLQFYFKYVVKQEMDGQSFIRKDKRSE